MAGAISCSVAGSFRPPEESAAARDCPDGPLKLRAAKAPYRVHCVSPPSQAEFEFGAPGNGADGLDAWQRQRLEAMRTLAGQVGLPLGREVEVRLVDGVTLRGRLRLREEVLVLDALELGRLEFEVDKVRFGHGEIASCLRLD